jgi:uncharacterized protein (TIGR03435 family)
MARVIFSALLTGVFLLGALHAQAQRRAPLEFDVASIKRNTNGPQSGAGGRTLPDGTFMMRNQPLMTVIINASPRPDVLLRNVIGLPDWAKNETYDVTVKPPPGSTRDEIREMWRTLLEQRMKLAAHVEERATTTFTLVAARSDGRLGPNLTTSSLDCGAPQAPEQASADPAKRCGMAVGATSIVSGGATIDMLARNLVGRAGGPVANGTSLEGNYAFTLNFSLPHPPGDVSVDAVPDFFTALEEQLGLKLLRERGSAPFFVIDHIERPTEN